MINRVIAGLMTVGFMAIVRPDKDVSLAGVALVSVLMYEAVRYSIERIRRERKQEKYIVATRISKQDIERWASQWFDPYEEIV